jgi:hypothetical protein
MPLVYLWGIIIAELVTFLFSPLIGIGVHAVILLSLIAHASVIWGRPGYQLYLSLTLAPLIRVLSLSLPLAGFRQLYWFLIAALPLFITLFVLIRVLNYRPGQVGLSIGRLPVQMGVAASGFFLGVVEYFILRPMPLIERLTWEHLWMAILILLIATGFGEELAFRGVMLRSAMDARGYWGLIYVTAVFASLHIGFLSLVDILFVFTVGLYFAWVVKNTGSLLGVSLCHGLINVALYLIAPFIF